MSLVGAVAIYFILWWMCMLIVVPFGVRTQADEDRVVPGSEAGAPVKTRLWRKMMVATLLALIVLGALELALRYTPLRDILPL